jgi:hypothetical protein
MLRGMSPTSSRKNVPLFAASKRPSLSLFAPVNAPRAYPNSSLSRSVSGIDPIVVGMNGPAPRLLSRWIARAKTSFPVPV